MLQSSVHRNLGLCGVAGALVVAGLGLPAYGQASMSETTVIGPRSHPDMISARVNYGDLDLTTKSGRAALHHRVERTAVTLCRRLGEDHLGAAQGIPSCEQDAVYSAARAEKAVIAAAAAQTYAGSPAPTSFIVTMNDAGTR